MFIAILKLLLVALVGLLTFGYYGLVFPPLLAGIAALAIVVIFGIAAFTDRIPWRMLMAGGPVIAAWPAGALLAETVLSGFGVDSRWELAAGWSWALPLAIHKIESAIAEKRDRARDLGGIALALICLYLIIQLALIRVDVAAASAASLGVALATLTTREHLLIGPTPRAVLAYAAAAAGVGAVGLGLRAVLF
jgi:hypothetical protein